MRKYASYFEFLTKTGKELSVSEDWLSTFGIKHHYDEASLVAVADQDRWPDCEVKMNSGEFCGIEITELVEAECIRRMEKGEKVYKWWTDKDVVKAIEERLGDKNTRSHGGKYKKLIVLIHTDEPRILFDDYRKAVEKYIFSGLRNIDEAYLVYSYESKYQHCPVSVLNVRA